MVVRNLFEKLALRGFRQANCSCSKPRPPTCRPAGSGVVQWSCLARWIVEGGVEGAQQIEELCVKWKGKKQKFGEGKLEVGVGWKRGEEKRWVSGVGGGSGGSGGASRVVRS